jgi:hypothetical protein
MSTYTISRYHKVVVTTVAVGSTSEQISPATQVANRQAVTITNCDATYYVYLAQISESTGDPTLTTTNYLEKLAPGASATYMAGGNVRFYAMNNSSPTTDGNVRFEEWV